MDKAETKSTKKEVHDAARQAGFVEGQKFERTQIVAALRHNGQALASQVRFDAAGALAFATMMQGQVLDNIAAGLAQLPFAAPEKPKA